MEMKPGIHSNYKCRNDNPSLLMKYDISIKQDCCVAFV